jgi:acylphosphatase
MENLTPTAKGEVAIYQPDNTIHLEVLTDQETVWLSQAQMSMLFQRDQSVISRHLNNIFREKELDEKSNMQILHITNVDRPTSFYNLDVIISVGYRVKSQQGILFRQWATKVLKEFIIKGYAINQRFERVETLAIDTEKRVAETEKKIEFFVKTALPPLEGIFSDGKIFDAYVFASNLIKSAKESIILIDNYVDESVLLLLSKRKKNVSAKILTANFTETLQQDLSKHNAQYPPITIEKFTKSHDRFLIIDDKETYLIGASLKKKKKKWFGFSKMESDWILSQL